MLPFARQYLSANYKGKVTILSQYCPTCLEATEHLTITPEWSTLFQEGHIQPEQALNAFNPLEGSFKDLLDLSTASRPCQECMPQCWICQSPITKGQVAVSSEAWPALKVHRSCVVRCDQAGCPVYLETIPRYIPFSPPKPLCARHAPKTAEPAPSRPSEPAKPARPSEPARPARPSEPARPSKPSEPAKPSKPSEPARPPKKPLKPTAASQKLIRINKECKTPPIASLLAKPKKEAPPPDELVRRRDNGEPWAYRRDGVLYRISDDEPVESREQPNFGFRKRKHDFTAPTTPHLSEPPHAQEEHEGQAGRQDPGEGAGPLVPLGEPVPDGEEQ